ncbi:hypothetical protein [Microbacterium sp. 22242]|uniref:hypothetical protein n=1 Tax=Microbacterium sp. 22242 TaxID=3453896 RepID=UPI003F865C90
MSARDVVDEIATTAGEVVAAELLPAPGSGAIVGHTIGASVGVGVVFGTEAPGADPVACPVVPPEAAAIAHAPPPRISTPAIAAAITMFLRVPGIGRLTDGEPCPARAPESAGAVDATAAGVGADTACAAERTSAVMGDDAGCAVEAAYTSTQFRNSS